MPSAACPAAPLRASLAQGESSLLSVIEGEALAADQLIALVSLARDEHHVPRLRARDRPRDGEPPVQAHLVAATGRAQALFDRLGDRLWRLVARIVVGQNRKL